MAQAEDKKIVIQIGPIKAYYKDPDYSSAMDLMSEFSEKRTQKGNFFMRVMAAAIGLCLQRNSGLKIEANYEDFDYNILKFGDSVFNDLMNQKIEIPDMTSAFQEIMKLLNTKLGGEAKKAENFLEEEPVISEPQDS